MSFTRRRSNKRKPLPSQDRGFLLLYIVNEKATFIRRFILVIYDKKDRNEVMKKLYLLLNILVFVIILFANIFPFIDINEDHQQLILIIINIITFIISVSVVFISEGKKRYGYRRIVTWVLVSITVIVGFYIFYLINTTEDINKRILLIDFVSDYISISSLGIVILSIISELSVTHIKNNNVNPQKHYRLINKRTFNTYNYRTNIRSQKYIGISNDGKYYISKYFF